jgi:quinol monooxygenase YgiN
MTARAGSEQELLQALAVLVGPARSGPGCISCDLLVSAADAATFITVETWRSQADLDARLQTRMSGRHSPRPVITWRRHRLSIR